MALKLAHPIVKYGMCFNKSVMIKSIGGSITSLMFFTIGSVSLQNWALIMGIASGAVTLIYTVYKFTRELLRDFKKDNIP